jgi:hypothetical protein
MIEIGNNVGLHFRSGSSQMLCLGYDLGTSDSSRGG